MQSTANIRNIQTKRNRFEIKKWRGWQHATCFSFRFIFFKNLISYNHFCFIFVCFVLLIFIYCNDKRGRTCRCVAGSAAGWKRALEWDEAWNGLCVRHPSTTECPMEAELNWTDDRQHWSDELGPRADRPELLQDGFQSISEPGTWLFLILNSFHRFYRTESTCKIWLVRFHHSEWIQTVRRNQWNRIKRGCNVFKNEYWLFGLTRLTQVSGSAQRGRFSAASIIKNSPSESTTLWRHKPISQKFTKESWEGGRAPGILHSVLKLWLNISHSLFFFSGGKSDNDRGCQRLLGSELERQHQRIETK